MTKKKFADLIEGLCELLVARSNGTLDEHGARAVLAMSVKRNQDMILDAALPKANADQPA
jgi:hypothetical protein